MGGDAPRGKRPYASALRRGQAAATRRRILAAAQRLFERDGYAATTIAGIAAEAGVSVRTVYVAFETKSGLLRALWHLLLRGDEEPVPVAERPWFRAVLEEPDPERALRLNVRNAVVVRERAAGLLAVLRDAAATEPEIAELWRRIEAEFYDNQRSVVESLDWAGALRPELDVAGATDILWTLNHPDVHRLLLARGWQPDRYERWLGDLLCSQLLRCTVPAPHARKESRC